MFPHVLKPGCRRRARRVAARWEGESPAANRRFWQVFIDRRRHPPSTTVSVLQYNAAWKLVLAGALKGGGRRSGESSMRSSPPMGRTRARRWNCCRGAWGAGFNTVEGWISGGGEGSPLAAALANHLASRVRTRAARRFGLGGLGPEEITRTDQESDAHQTKGAQGLKDPAMNRRHMRRNEIGAGGLPPGLRRRSRDRVACVALTSAPISFRRMCRLFIAGLLDLAHPLSDVRHFLGRRVFPLAPSRQVQNALAARVRTREARWFAKAAASGCLRHHR